MTADEARRLAAATLDAQVMARIRADIEAASRKGGWHTTASVSGSWGGQAAEILRRDGYVAEYVDGWLHVDWSPQPDAEKGETPACLWLRFIDGSAHDLRDRDQLRDTWKDYDAIATKSHVWMQLYELQRLAWEAWIRRRRDELSAAGAALCGDLGCRVVGCTQHPAASPPRHNHPDEEAVPRLDYDEELARIAGVAGVRVEHDASDRDALLGIEGGRDDR